VAQFAGRKADNVVVDLWDLRARGLPGIGLVTAGADLPALIAEAAAADGLVLADGDVVVVAQKIVSKAEGRVVDLATVTPSGRALRLGERTGRDPRLCQLYLDESRAVLAVKGRHVVTIDRMGLQNTGAGVDMSNVAARVQGLAVLLPLDPDASARRIRDGLRSLLGVTVAVIVSDSFGSDNRDGAVGAAIGIAGIRHLEESDGVDLFANPSRPAINRVDELAATASIIMGQTDAARPAVVIRGATYTVDEDAALARLLVGPPLPMVDADLAAADA